MTLDHPTINKQPSAEMRKRLAGLVHIANMKRMERERESA